MNDTYSAEILWQRDGQLFTDNRYSREYVMRFDGGIEVPGSSSVHVVPLPFSVEKAVDPEEAFVAALSGCHMLWFLSIAAKRGYTVDTYHDQPVGLMARDERKKFAMTRVTLRPHVRFSGAQVPGPDVIDKMHHDAHEECFIANSIKSEIRIEPRGAE